MDIYKYTIFELIKKKVKTAKELDKVKRKMAKISNTSCSSNILLLKAYHDLLKKGRIKKEVEIEKILRKRPVRTLSGVAVVSVLTKPYPCPGKCIFCPEEKGMPKSYLKGEPAAERAFKLNFDPYLQVKKRIESLVNQGHPTDKIEIRVIGASFTSYPKKYKVQFFSNLFAAANQRKRTSNLEKEKEINEKTKHRIVGTSIETRPDLINKGEIILMRKLGITMVELGVQTTLNKILKKCRRGHTVKETITATKLLKDAGFKVMYQLMPNLPGSNPKEDLKSFKEVFKNQNFKPDWIKIYPCLVCKGSDLFKEWKKGKFKPYSDKELINLLIKIKKILPFWVRLARMFRDIPSSKIEAGSKLSNIREIVQKKMKEKCKCIRCREVKERYDKKEKVFLFKEEYKASDGKEIFLSFENKKRTKLFAFLRLRIPSSNKNHFIKSLKNSVIIRELHTYGQQTPLGETYLSPQHKGLGKKLVKESEKITKDLKKKRIAVISGVGVRDYYRKLGFRKDKEYMVKILH